MRKIISAVVIASSAVLVAGTAIAQPGYGYRPPVHGGYGSNHGGHGNRDAGIALGALVVGGILGYAVSQSNAQSAAAPVYYPPVANQNSYYGETVYSAPVVQPMPAVVVPSTYATPVYQAPVVPAPVQYESIVVNGRTYYRPVQ